MWWVSQPFVGPSGTITSVSLHGLHSRCTISALLSVGHSLLHISKNHPSSLQDSSSRVLPIPLHPVSQEKAFLSTIPPSPALCSALLANTLKSSSVCTPGSCQYLFSRSLTSQGIAPPLHMHQSRYPHPISQDPVPSQSDT